MTVIDVDEADFQTEVVARSAELPVVVDFWAPWCAPCRQLGPVLERAAEARDGQVVLVKIDTDQNPGIAQQFGIQGIPAVKAFVDGEVAAEFVGAQGATQVEAFFDALVPTEADLLLGAGDEDSLRRVLELDPKNPAANVKLARMRHAAGDPEAARALLANVTGDFAADGLAARIELEQQDGASPRLAEAFAALDAGDTEAGLDILLDALAATDPAGEDRERLRKLIVAVLDELGVEHPLARESRRRLAAALY